MTKATYPTASAGGFVTAGDNSMGCFKIRDFIFIMVEADRYSVRWCAIGDPTDWPTPNTDDARAKQAGQQVFNNEFGLVTGGAGNDFFGYIFQERAVWKATYVGGDVVFNFDAFEEGRGCGNLNRLAQIDDKVFYESNFGYHLLENGVIADIGLSRVDKSFTPSKT